MRRLLLSDIHANMEAMDACLARAGEAGFDSVICCGDIVGYGPEPNEAVEKLEALKAVSIRGNHDRVACGQDEPTGFNPHAKAAAFWTRDTLIEKNHAYLRALPVGPLDIGDGAQLVHGAVTDEDDYIMSESHAAESFALTETHLTFFGHSHHPAVYTCDRSGNIVEELQKHAEDSITTHLRNDMRYLINPGSVGQPRDGNTRSAFLIWDSDELRLEFYRAEYPVELTQEKMEKVGLPHYLIERLTYGR
jgi:predicted phosphodiesterase